MEAERGPPPLPIVAVTAMTLTDDREKSLQTGMDYFLSKPVKKVALQKQILAAVQKGREPLNISSDH
jgi:CheY-like chemotaxis protein